MMEEDPTMLRKFIGAMVVAAIVAVPARQVTAQVGVGYTDVGVVVGLGNLGNANLSFGGRFEHIFKALPDLGNGLLGIEVSVDYYGYSNKYGAYKSDLSVIPIGGTANYHFKLDNKKVDLFVGAGLGYQLYSCSYNGPGITGTDYCSNSSLYFIGRAGGRYFLSNSMALYGDLGAGAATLNLGLTFKLK